MSKYTIAVVTEVPDIKSGEDGNACAPLVHGLDPAVMMHVMTQGRVEVFSLGEILILDANGRDIGTTRKPSKWFIETEEFDTLDAAVERALEVRGDV